jgi:hypothetical protein
MSTLRSVGSRQVQNQGENAVSTITTKDGTQIYYIRKQGNDPMTCVTNTMETIP